ncbi:MAG TPA: DNA polymerase IV [Acidimicrobiia bacterium]|jgi:DNA polymerase-4
MGLSASILHADLDAFYASVEQRDNPILRGKPVIVGGGVVLSASYEARAYGVHSPMGGGEARLLCPHAIVVPPRMDAYVEASKAVFAIFDDTTPLVEPISIDEAFLDVGGLLRIAGQPIEIASRLRASVRQRVGLPITVGVATTKFLAKVASAVAKPDGLLVVPAGGELDFLHPLPVRRLWGVGPVTGVKLAELGIETIGDIARFRPKMLARVLGQAVGSHLYALSNNQDPRRVQGRRRRSIGSQRALGRRERAPAEIEEILLGIVDRVTRRLRDGGRVGRTVTVRLRFNDFTRATRSHTFPEATADTHLFLAAARDLLEEAGPLIARQGLTLVGLTISNLERDDAVQLALPFDRHNSNLDRAIDELKERFGKDSVIRAALLGKDEGLSVPLLRD